MADKKCKKGSRSGAHGIARSAITTRNKARKAKRYAKWLAKRQAKAAAAAALEAPREIVTMSRRGVHGRKFMEKDDPSIHTIIFRDTEDGKKSVHRVKIEGATPEGYLQSSKDAPPATVHFLTESGKKWTMRFNEFSFFMPARKVAKDVVKLLQMAAQPQEAVVVGQPG